MNVYWVQVGVMILRGGGGGRLSCPGVTCYGRYLFLASTLI